MFTAESAFLPWPSSSLSPPWRERQFSRGSHPFICCATVMHSLHVRTLTFRIPVTECDPSIRCQEPVRNPGHVCVYLCPAPARREGCCAGKAATSQSWVILGFISAQLQLGIFQCFPQNGTWEHAMGTSGFWGFFSMENMAWFICVYKQIYFKLKRRVELCLFCSFSWTWS